MANINRPQFNLKNALAYPAALGVGVYGSLHLMTGFEYSVYEMPLQVTGIVTLGYSITYAMMPILYDFGPAIKRLERNGKKVFLTAKGERTINVSGPMQASALARLDLKQRKKMHSQVQEPGAIVATRDVVFYHNGKPISGKIYSQWLERGYALQRNFASEGKTASGLAKRQRGDIKERYWKRLYDILDYTVQYYTAERGLVLAENKNGGYHLRYSPGVIYDCSCSLLL